MAQVSIKIIDGVHPREIIGELQGRGFVLEQSLETLGVLIGTCPAAALSKLHSVRGVAAIEESRSDYVTQNLDSR